jgi:hypothetical protein
MRPTDALRAIAYPLTELAVLIPVVVLWLLVSFAIWGGVLGLFLLFLVIPAVFRFQMIVLEARARGVTPATPDAEFFNWFGNAWTLFPVPVVVGLVWITVATSQTFGTAWAILPVLFASVFFPASIAVLAITQSPLQSLNPVALGRLLKKCSGMFWLATLFLIVAAWLSVEAGTLPTIWATLSWMLLSFAFFSLVGSLIEPYGLMKEVDIPAPLEKSADETDIELEKARTHALNHAYGFISRDNRAGGFEHIFDQIEHDPDPVAAWAWFFGRMLAWEDRNHALFFAQHYVHDMLSHGENVPAVKVIMRCRLIDECFKPLREDLPAAVAAAESIGNIELAVVLKSG